VYLQSCLWVQVHTNSLRQCYQPRVVPRYTCVGTWDVHPLLSCSSVRMRNVTLWLKSGHLEILPSMSSSSWKVLQPVFRPWLPWLLGFKNHRVFVRWVCQLHVITQPGGKSTYVSWKIFCWRVCKKYPAPQVLGVRKVYRTVEKYWITVHCWINIMYENLCYSQSKQGCEQLQ
jgi:hypothetical protein